MGHQPTQLLNAPLHDLPTKERVEANENDDVSSVMGEEATRMKEKREMTYEERNKQSGVTHA